MDRREAIDILVGVIATNSEEENEALDLAIEALKEPTERTGEWKMWNEPGNSFAYCNKCKHEYDQLDLYLGGNEYPNYCPNCGAKMKGQMI